MGWVYAPERSATGAVVFEHFVPEQAILRVDVFPSASPLYTEPGAWSAAMGTALSTRIAADVTLRLLPDNETASGIERSPSNQRNRRLVAFRGDPVDVAVTIESATERDGPFMIDTVRLVRSSFRFHKAEPDPADLASRMLGLLRDSWRHGTPPTRHVVGAAHAMWQQGMAQSTAEPVFTAAVMLDQQLRTAEETPSRDDSEARLLRSQVDGVRASIAEIFKKLGAPEASLDSPAQVAQAHSELILNLYLSRGGTSIDGAIMHALALAELLTFARSEAGLLSRLWGVMSRPERGTHSEGDIAPEVLEGIALLASNMADSSFDLGDRGGCQEGDSLASAALRLLFAHQPNGELGGTPVQSQLMYRLLAASIHLRANQDPTSIEEANRLRTEAGTLDPSGELAKIYPEEDQRLAFDRLMLIPNIPAGDPLAAPASNCRQGQMQLVLGHEEAAVSALTQARQQLARLSSALPPNSPPELTQLIRMGDLYVDLADLSRRLGRIDEALELLKQAVTHTLPMVSGYSFRLMMVASSIYVDVDPALATRWVDGAAVIADGLRLATRPGEERVRFADSALLEQTYDTAIAGHLAGDDLYAAISMADRSRGRFLFEAIGSGDKSISPVEYFMPDTAMPADPLPPALGGPTNARLSVETVAEGLGTAAAPVIPDGLPRQLDALRSALLDEVTRKCVEARTPVALSPARVAGMSIYLRSVLLVQESGDDLILFVLDAGDVPDPGNGTATSGDLLSRQNLDAVGQFVLSQETVHHVRVPGCRRRLADAVKVIQQWMGIHESTHWPVIDSEVPTQDAFDSALAVLSELIVAPVAGFLPPGTDLTVVPSRALGLVPWGLLKDPGGRFLLDRHAITIAPSLSILHALFERSQREAPASFHAYIAADPALEGRQQILGELPYAREEAEDLSSRLKRLDHAETTRREGPAATAISYWLEAAGASLVHLASHAELAYPAELSVIHLSGGGLAAYQVADVPLTSAIVFLAACDTGQGRVSSDGVLGLGQNFLQAGAQAVILALTKVNDAVTAKMASHFYEALLGNAKGMTAARALQSAVLATRSDLEAGRVIQDGEVIQPDPVSWGAFYVLGHPYARLRLDHAKELQ